MSEVKTVSMRYDKYIEMKEKAEKYPALVEKLKEFVFEIGDLSDAIIKVIEERDTAIEDINSLINHNCEHPEEKCFHCAFCNDILCGKKCLKDKAMWRGIAKIHIWNSNPGKLAYVPVVYGDCSNLLRLIKPATLPNGDLRFPFIITDDPEALKKQLIKEIETITEDDDAENTL